MQLNLIQYNTSKYPVIPCNNIEYNIIPCNTMKYYATPRKTRYTILQRIILHSQQTLIDIFRWQLGLNLAPWGPLRTYGAPKRVFWGPNRPCLPVFDRFLELGGSKLAITVLDEQGIPLRCSGHPTSLYLKQKISITKFGPGNLGTGTKQPFLAPRGPRWGPIPS